MKKAIAETRLKNPRRMARLFVFFDRQLTMAFIGYRMGSVRAEGQKTRSRQRGRSGYNGST